MAQPPGQSDLLSELASSLSATRPDSPDLEPLDVTGRALLLRIARDVAHATERQNAPLAAYLIGRFVQESVIAGFSEADALARAESVVRFVIGAGPD